MNTGIIKVFYSDVSIIQMIIIQIPLDLVKRAFRPEQNSIEGKVQHKMGRRKIWDCILCDKIL